MAQRLSRVERQEQTRAKLVAAAQKVFLRRGFHDASVDEIAQVAGYTTGAVYSNFEDKDELFLAVFDAERERRIPAQAELMAKATSLEQALRDTAREYRRHAEEIPEWTGLYVEFWIHASRRPRLRREISNRHEQLLDTVGTMVDDLTRRWNVELSISGRDAARGFYALSRGLGLEHLLGGQLANAALFEEMCVSFVKGLIRPEAIARRRKGKKASHGSKHDTSIPNRT